MNKLFKLFGIVALAAAIGLSFAGCDTGGDSPAPAPAGGTGGSAGSQRSVYTWNDAESNSYRLEITEAPNSRAVYTPKQGDTYVLTITPKVGKPQKSNGTVTLSNSTTIILKPDNSPTTFTITVTPTDTTVIVTGMGGTITFEDGKTKEVIPIFDTFDFKAEMWYYDEAGDIGETWQNTLPLSYFTSVTPKKGDKFTFEISGTINNTMEWFNLEIYYLPSWTTIGVSDKQEISGPFKKEFVINIHEDPKPTATEFRISMINHLYHMYSHNVTANNARLPEGTQRGDVMATVSNFEIRLLPNKD